MATYDADLIEIDIEDIFFAGMEFEKPVMRMSVLDGLLLDITDDVTAIESFTSGGVVLPIVCGVGVMTELDIEELIEPVGMSYERPVVWNAVSAGTCAEIPIGTVPTWPGDTMALIDFEEEYGKDLAVSISSGTVMIAVNSQTHYLIGGISDAILGFSQLGIIRFLKPNQFEDLLE